MCVCVCVSVYVNLYGICTFTYSTYLQYRFCYLDCLKISCKFLGFDEKKVKIRSILVSMFTYKTLKNYDLPMIVNPPPRIDTPLNYSKILMIAIIKLLFLVIWYLPLLPTVDANTYKQSRFIILRLKHYLKLIITIIYLRHKIIQLLM